MVIDYFHIKVMINRFYMRCWQLVNFDEFGLAISISVARTDFSVMISPKMVELELNCLNFHIILDLVSKIAISYSIYYNLFFAIVLPFYKNTIVI